MPAYAISMAHWPEDLEAARVLLTHYGKHLAASPVAAAGFCFADYETEVHALPGKYATDLAALFLARAEGVAAGCVAINRRLLPDQTKAAEIKRLWVEAGFRGRGLGRNLVLSAIEGARLKGYASVVLDTVNEAMPEAASLYRSLGFQEIERFNDNPIDDVHFYQLWL